MTQIFQTNITAMQDADGTKEILLCLRRTKGRISMRITLDIPDGIICGFLNCVEHTKAGLQLVSYQLSSDDFTDGNTVKLPREREEGAD